MTQMQAARQGIITEEMRLVAQDEGVDVEWLQEQIAKGRVVIPRNINHPNYYPIGIGEGLADEGQRQHRHFARPCGLGRGVAEGGSVRALRR
jgi:hypothetical protein